MNAYVRVHLVQYLAQFFLGMRMFQTNIVEKIKTHILCSTHFSPKIVPIRRFIIIIIIIIIII
jgi:hypothetical protein